MGNKFLSSPLSPGILYLPDHLGSPRPECPTTSDTWQSVDSPVACRTSAPPSAPCRVL